MMATLPDLDALQELQRKWEVRAVHCDEQVRHLDRMQKTDSTEFRRASAGASAVTYRQCAAQLRKACGG